MSGRARLWALVAAVASIAALEGCVPLAVAGIGAGATAVVATTEKRGLSGYASDQQIRADISKRWLEASLDMYGRIGLTINQGQVLLTGWAKDAGMRGEAARLAWQAEGVKALFNEIQIDDDATGTFDGARDSWISTQLRTKLTLDPEVSSQNYSIDTVAGVVYLMGDAKSQQELDRVLAQARALPDVRRVVSYVRQ